ncbi:MAG TPA: hypothetical protein VEO54_09525 [Thermoanaerobaculia bacterium]|nr:hypothetical protein [Thermoanaerobaculia bacterium]
MKRLLLLLALTLLALSVPTTASACMSFCDDLFGVCAPSSFEGTTCIAGETFCHTEYCRAPERAPSSLKWKIASVEIERRAPAGKRESEIRIASRDTRPEAAKPESSSLE